MCPAYSQEACPAGRWFPSKQRPGRGPRNAAGPGACRLPGACSRLKGASLPPPHFGIPTLPSPERPPCPLPRGSPALGLLAAHRPAGGACSCLSRGQPHRFARGTARSIVPPTLSVPELVRSPAAGAETRHVCGGLHPSPHPGPAGRQPPGHEKNQVQNCLPKASARQSLEGRAAGGQGEGPRPGTATTLLPALTQERGGVTPPPALPGRPAGFTRCVCTAATSAGGRSVPGESSNRLFRPLELWGCRFCLSGFGSLLMVTSVPFESLNSGVST